MMFNQNPKLASMLSHSTFTFEDIIKPKTALFLVTDLEDGRSSFPNNLSENAIRPFTAGRKSWLFCDTPHGAQASAIV